MNKRTLVIIALVVAPILVLSALRVPALSLGSASAESTVLDALQTTLEEIYEQVGPSVVNIQVVQTAGSLQAHPEIPGLPTDPSLPGQPFQAEGLGSGFVWDREGHIVTNNHVVAGAQEITVTFSDGTSARGEVVGADPNSDLAVLKVDVPASELQPVAVADSTRVNVGQLAVAIGNPFGLEGTMTVGFVSALGRSLPVESGNMTGSAYTIPDVIQTDAPINPGNSGGVLVDDEGRLIGVPTAIESPVRANAGIGFAVPSVIVDKVVPALISEGLYEHPWLGITATTLPTEVAAAMNLDSDQRGVLVVGVSEDSPAARAGLLAGDREIEIDGRPAVIGGDVIAAIDGQPVEDFADLVTYLARHAAVNQTVELTILREGREAKVDVTLAARPETQDVQEMPEVATTGGAWLGIRGVTLTAELAEAMDLPADQHGVLIQEILHNTAAEEAGLLGGNQMLEFDGQQVSVGGDVITALAGEPIRTFEELRDNLLQSEPGQELALTVLRDGAEATVDVTLGERPTTTP